MTHTKDKVRRVRLTPETREQLIRSYVERRLTKYKMLPTEQQVLEAVGGNIINIRKVLREYRQKLPTNAFSHKGRHLIYKQSAKF